MKKLLMSLSILLVMAVLGCSVVPHEQQAEKVNQKQEIEAEAAKVTEPSQAAENEAKPMGQEAEAKPGNTAPAGNQPAPTGNQPDQYAPTGYQPEPTGYEDGGIGFAFLFYHEMAWSQEDLFDKLPEGFVEVGTIQKNDNAHVPQEELASCRLSEGLKVFGSDKYMRAIFVEREDRQFVLFWPYNGQILNFEPDYNQEEEFPAGEVARRFLSYRGELWTDYGIVDNLPESYGDIYLPIYQNDNTKLPDENEFLFSTQLKEGAMVYFSKLEPEVVYVQREEGGFYRFLPYRADASAWVPMP